MGILWLEDQAPKLPQSREFSDLAPRTQNPEFIQNHQNPSRFSAFVGANHQEKSLHELICESPKQTHKETGSNTRNRKSHKVTKKSHGMNTKIT
jgi:hypothetical protein